MSYGESFPAPKVPSPSELLAGTSPPEWILAEAGNLARSPVLLDRVAMVGMLARLGAASTAKPHAVLRRLLSGQQSPGDRARAWARGLDDETLEAISHLFFDRLGRFTDDMRHLAKLMRRGGNGALTDMIVYVALERDLLESVGYILQGARPRSPLAHDVRRYLALADSNARQWGLAKMRAPCDDYPVLGAVFWQEPDSWWAQCAY
jgi:hypothetical protein